MGYLGFGQKGTEAKRLSTMATTFRMYSVSFVMDIHSAKFQEHCLNISRDIVSSEKRHFKKKIAIPLYFESPFK